MRTQSVTILTARNKSFIGKVGVIEGDEIKIGRTTYNFQWANHQPRKAKGDFSIEESSIEDNVGFTLNKDGKDVTMVFSYEINE